MANLVNGHSKGQTRNIADPFLDLLSELDDGPRMGMVQRLATGYYDGWRPTRTELANLIARETGRMTEAEYLYFRRSQNVPESLQRLGINGSRLTPKDLVQPRPPHPASATGVDDTNRPDMSSQRMPAFTVACGELVPTSDFVARGLASGGWVQRGTGLYRLVSLQYDLVPRGLSTLRSRDPLVFTGRITCTADIAAPRQQADGQSTTHTIGARRVMGVRGPWPVCSDVRHLRFVIYGQAPDHDPALHPAGVLWVDLKRGEAHWRQIIDRRTVNARPESLVAGSMA
jgi:hypothetical protein